MRRLTGIDSVPCGVGPPLQRHRTISPLPIASICGFSLADTEGPSSRAVNTQKRGPWALDIVLQLVEALLSRLATYEPTLPEVSNHGGVHLPEQHQGPLRRDASHVGGLRRPDALKLHARAALDDAHLPHRSREAGGPGREVTGQDTSGRTQETARHYK
jgi:hypothetical protein